MKSYLLILLFALTSIAAYGQAKIGYVDSDAIMDELPDAQDARRQLDGFIQEWQAELGKLEKEWKDKYNDYERRKLIMSDQVRSEVEGELVKMEQKIAEYREKKFGTNGELFLKQDELMKPIQNKIFTVIKQVAEEGEYDFVFDRSGGILMLYAKEKHDLTATVLEKMK